MKYTSNHKALKRQGKIIFREMYSRGIPGRIPAQWYILKSWDQEMEVVERDIPDQETAVEKCRALCDGINTIYFGDTLVPKS